MTEGKHENSLRGKDWIFNVLWSGTLAAKYSDKNPDDPIYVSDKCCLNIPTTFIFLNGRPFKALHTAGNGYIERLSLDPWSRNEETEDLTGDIDATAYLYSLKVCRQCLVDFSKRFSYTQFQEENKEKFRQSTFCKVYYLDGKDEELTLKMYDVLITNEN